MSTLLEAGTIHLYTPCQSLASDTGCALYLLNQWVGGLAWLKVLS